MGCTVKTVQVGWQPEFIGGSRGLVCAALLRLRMVVPNSKSYTNCICVWIGTATANVALCDPSLVPNARGFTNTRRGARTYVTKN